MSIIVNGIDIPTTGDFIKVGSADIDRVNVVTGGVTTTVWEKMKNLIIHDSRATYGNPQLGKPTESNNYVVAPLYNVKKGQADECFFSNIYDSGCENIWTNEYGTFYSEKSDPFMNCSPALEKIRYMDLTNYNKMICTYCGDITAKPSGFETTIVRMYLGFKDKSHTLQLGMRVARSENSPMGEDDYKTGLLWGNVEDGPCVWWSSILDISDLTGVHKLFCAVDRGSYRSEGWLRLDYIELTQ